MSTKPVVAVIGTGSIGTRHLGILRTLGAKAVAIPLRSERRTELERQGWETAADLSSAWGAGARAVVVATETARHAPDSSMALSLGMAVLCEKPMAATAIEARTMLTKAEGGCLPLFVACCLRFDEGLQRFHERIPAIGPVHSARAECRSYLPDWRKGRDYRNTYAARGPRHGILLDIIHEVDYSCWCFGAPESVSGRFLNTRSLGLESAEGAEGLWATPSGGLVSVGLDYLTRKTVRFVRAAGSDGELVYDFEVRTLTSLGPGGATQRECIEGDRDEMYSRQLSAFLRAADGGEPGPLATATEGVMALQVCEAWAASAETGSEERVQ